MPLKISTTLKRLLPSPLALQGVVAVIALAFALSPAHGGTALYLPLDGSDTANAVAWSRQNGARLLAPGPYDGAFIIRVNASKDALSAYSSGALLISVPEFLCGGPETETAKTS
ncbi:MAG: hypothetical protein CMH85_08260 [Novosphingobium sp.]|jgi:hypothetical protein|uniref:Uncharacterized protein n=1 Tax=Novosphingobium indicum TaxID=462949 RepID=A0ABQ2JD72_9SPHN|nr:hypothetical protein [Novosphingobium indicum]MAC58256.1 hypothetical protein [Novosphingobium sp.]GGN44661.1 hypothetical protein GCM10011349_09970 [Novosphingobium indicum]